MLAFLCTVLNGMQAQWRAVEVSWWSSYLTPEQLADTDEDTPQPLVDGERRAGEGLPA